jgi:3-oxoadipate enol-lactonase
LQGQGTPVMLSHALGLDLTMWDELAARLATRPDGPHEVLRHDHRGHGESAAPAGPYRMDDLVDDAARVIREWGRGPVAFVGLSMGAMVGQGLAIRHPELVSRLVLANTVARYTPEVIAGWSQRIAAVRAHGVASITEMVVERYLHADFRARHPEAAERIRARLLRDEAASYAACCEAVAGVDWLDRLATIRCPTLVISGARDVGAPPAEGQAIAERVPGAVFRVIDDASHLSVMEAPEEFATLVGGFLRTETD